MKNSEVKRLILEGRLPPKSKFVGYIVTKLISDEFLGSIQDKGDSYIWGWMRLPHKAIRFKTEDAAKKMAEEYGKDAIVEGLLETNKQFIVLSEFSDEEKDRIRKEMAEFAQNHKGGS